MNIFHYLASTRHQKLKVGDEIFVTISTDGWFGDRVVAKGTYIRRYLPGPEPLYMFRVKSLRNSL